MAHATLFLLAARSSSHAAPTTIHAVGASARGAAPDNASKQALMSYAWWSSPEGEAAEKRWVAFMQK